MLKHIQFRKSSRVLVGILVVLSILGFTLVSRHEPALADTSGVRITTNFKEGDTLAWPASVQVTVTISNSSGLKKGDGLIVSYPTNGSVF